MCFGHLHCFLCLGSRSPLAEARSLKGHNCPLLIAAAACSIAKCKPTFYTLSIIRILVALPATDQHTRTLFEPQTNSFFVPPVKHIAYKQNKHFRPPLFIRLGPQRRNSQAIPMLRPKSALSFVLQQYLLFHLLPIKRKAMSYRADIVHCDEFDASLTLTFFNCF